MCQGAHGYLCSGLAQALSVPVCLSACSHCPLLPSEPCDCLSIPFSIPGQFCCPLLPTFWLPSKRPSIAEVREFMPNAIEVVSSTLPLPCPPQPPTAHQPGAVLSCRWMCTMSIHHQGWQRGSELHPPACWEGHRERMQHCLRWRWLQMCRSCCLGSCWQMGSRLFQSTPGFPSSSIYLH